MQTERKWSAFDRLAKGLLQIYCGLSASWHDYIDKPVEPIEITAHYTTVTQLPFALTKHRL